VGQAHERQPTRMTVRPRRRRSAASTATSTRASCREHRRGGARRTSPCTKTAGSSGGAVPGWPALSDPVVAPVALGH
jgi:hypothetical protein